MRRSLFVFAGIGGLVVSAACAPRVPPSRVERVEVERPAAASAPAEVVFDLASSCPRVAVDRAGRLFSVVMTEAAPDAGAPGEGAAGLGIEMLGKNAIAWHHELSGRIVDFALADAHLGEGLAVAVAAIEPVRSLDAATRGRGMLVVSLAADGTTRFTRRIDALGGAASLPRVTAIVLGSHSEVTVAGTTGEALDFGAGSLARDEGAYDDTMVFIARYSPDGTLVFSTARKAKLGTKPRLVAWAEGTAAVAYDARDGRPAIEWLDPLGHGAPASVALAGSIRAMATAGRDDVVVATQGADAKTGAPVIELARLTRRGDKTWTTSMQGELQDGALTVRANGDTWFGGWFDGAPTACASPPPKTASDSSGPLPRLQIVSADGRRCRSLPFATRDARWTTPASLVTHTAGRILYATPYLGTIELPGVASRSSGAAPSRCALFDLPADALEYAP